MKHPVLFLGLASILSACGGGSSEDFSTIGEDAVRLFYVPDELAFRTGASGLNYIVDGTEGAVFTRGESRTVGQRTYDAALARDSIAWIELASGNGLAVAVDSQGDAIQVPGLQAFGYYLEAYGDTVLPTTSSDMTYLGEYVGFWARQGLNDTSSTFDTAILGDALVTINFDTGDVSGAITNRRSEDVSPNDFGDISLSGTLTDGSVDLGFASGGNWSATMSSFPAVGQFDLIVVGAEGEEVLGGLWMRNFENIAVNEIGVFSGAR